MQPGQGRISPTRPTLLSLGDRIAKGVAALSASLFAWPPARAYARRYIVPRVLPQMMTGDVPTQEMAAVRRNLQRLASSRDPILVGPWVSEVGFELLYWIPFLNWVTTYRVFDPERLIVVSRGGVAPWYRHLTDRYVDLFDFYTPDEFRVRNNDRQRGHRQKHLTPSELDLEIADRVGRHVETTHLESLHPMYMYRLFYPFWKSKMSMHLVDTFASFRPLSPIDTSAVDGHLPRDFVAVRFYFNESFPETEQNRAFVSRVIERLTETSDVVLLDPDMRIDDHRDVPVGARPRVHGVQHLVTPRNNLQIQTQVVSRARAFVGTYGGLSYLAPLYGVPAVGFYSDRTRFSPQHLDLARRVFARFDGGGYVVIDTRDADLVAMTLGDRAHAGQGVLPSDPGRRA